jgi:ATP-dependent exoDNAse (exonuclease V) beta subunit
MTGARHLLIRASAGTGKTHALTDRFVALLAAGAAPERIVALTFTRKAAGEFFDGILRKLADAARDAEAAERLARDIGRPDLGAADFLRLLRAVVDALPLLRLGTLDGFFARIVRSFPLELGLAGDFEVLDEAAQRVERRRVLQRLMLVGRATAEERRSFLEAFKRATFGVEEKRPGAQLDRFLDLHHQRYLEVPDAAAWGDPARIWPEGQAWLDAGDPQGPRAALARWLESAPIKDRQRRRWEDFLAGLGTWTPGAPLPAPVAYVVERALEQFDALARGAGDLRFDKSPQPLDPPAAAAVAALAAHVAGGELRRRLERTRGLHAVLARYDAAHDALVRRAGRLTFADVERLLRAEPGAPLGAEDRLLLDYRLDGGVDHWLLDEFQDTSRGQWSVLSNLVDEAVQDPEGRRTFFCVGDVKQAIYAWRAGDPRLMGEILDRYNRGGTEVVATRPLDASWRSGPAVVALVNAALGAGEALAGVLPGGAVARWKAEWRIHETAVPERDGQAAVLVAPDGEARRRVVLELLREIAPLERGLTCAVLVRTNDQALALADFLRREGGVPAVAESDLAVATDNPLGAALLALFQAAAHPGDTLARELVRMSPLGPLLAAEGADEREAWTRRVLDGVQRDGFERSAAAWIRRLLAAVGADAFARLRARQFLAGAAEFDRGGSRDVDEFIAFMERHRVREAEAAGVVRVMTVHKSKGLGFDLVVLPELEGGGIDSPREGLAVGRDGDGAASWVLDLPPGKFARGDRVLAAHLERAREEAAFEALSVLYVALTRARHGLYVVIEPPGTSEARSVPRLLTAALGDAERRVRVGAREFDGCWAEGSGQWHEPIHRRGAPAGAPELPVVAVPAVPRLPARRATTRPGADSRFAGFRVGRPDGRAHGAEVHALLAEVEWCRPEEAAAWAERWRAAGAAGAVVAAATAGLTAPGLVALWVPPAASRLEVWRERAFEAVVAGTWISGVFDRVVVERAGDGTPVSALVVDFKTDRIAGEADLAGAVDRHRSQLEAYRAVVAQLTGLDASRVRAELAFLAVGRRVECPVN